VSACRAAPTTVPTIRPMPAEHAERNPTLRLALVEAENEIALPLTVRDRTGLDFHPASCGNSGCSIVRDW